MNSKQTDTILAALNDFAIETPSWGYANTGTRFGKFLQESAAVTIADKMQDAGEVHRLTGSCPSVAIHVLWDLGEGGAAELNALAQTHGVRVGSINANLFEEQCYKLGSFGNPDADIRAKAVAHAIDSVKVARETGSKVMTLWFADGTNYPGQDNIRRRKATFEEGLKQVHDASEPGELILVEYKPFEPAFYHTDIGDWGMALHLAKKCGPNAKVLVDTGHHYQSQNIEQIVAWLLDEEMLGGFHFNDRRYADDDLTLGSIDPYQIFRIFSEIAGYTFDTGKVPAIEYMVDQSHNLKPKMEAMIQTVATAQELWAKAQLIDFGAMRSAQEKGNIVDAEECLKSAFRTDVTPAIAQWRQSKNLPTDPMAELRASKYLEKTAQDRADRRQEAGSYA